MEVARYGKYSADRHPAAPWLDWRAESVPHSEVSDTGGAACLRTPDILLPLRASPDTDSAARISWTPKWAHRRNTKRFRFAGNPIQEWLPFPGPPPGSSAGSSSAGHC